MPLRIIYILLLVIGLTACDKVNPVKAATHSTQELADEIKAIVGYQPSISATWSVDGKLESVNITLYGSSLNKTAATFPATIKTTIQKHLKQTPSTITVSYQFKAGEL